MDIAKGMILRPGNLPGWWDFPIRDRVSHHLGLPVTFANDANAAAYGEFWSGAGKQYHSLVLLTLGTGIGGGIIVGDTLIEGEHSCGSECGHILINPADDAPMDSLGKRGSLESYATRRRSSTGHWPRSGSVTVTSLAQASRGGRGDHAAVDRPGSRAGRRGGPPRDHGDGLLAGDRHRVVHPHDRSGCGACSAAR